MLFLAFLAACNLWLEGSVGDGLDGLLRCLLYAVTNRYLHRRLYRLFYFFGQLFVCLLTHSLYDLFHYRAGRNVLLTTLATFFAVFVAKRSDAASRFAGSDAAQSSLKTLSSAAMAERSRKITPISRRASNSSWRRLWLPRKAWRRSRIMTRVCRRILFSSREGSRPPLT